MAAVVVWSLIAFGIFCGIAISAVLAGGLVFFGVAVGSERLSRCGTAAWHVGSRLWSVVLVAHVAVAAVWLVSFLAR